LHQLNGSFDPSHMGATFSLRKHHDTSYMRNSIHINNNQALNDLISSKDDIRTLLSPTSSGYGGNRMNTSRQSSRVGGVNLNNQSFLPIQGLKRTVQRQPISVLDSSLLSSGPSSFRGSTAAHAGSL
jgi:hypothetical protein